MQHGASAILTPSRASTRHSQCSTSSVVCRECSDLSSSRASSSALCSSLTSSSLGMSSGRDFKTVLDLVDSVILKKCLAKRKEEISERFDELSLIIKKVCELNAESESVLDIPTLRSIVVSFIFGGRDTTVMTILYALYVLAQFSTEHGTTKSPRSSTVERRQDGADVRGPRASRTSRICCGRCMMRLHLPVQSNTGTTRSSGVRSNWDRDTPSPALVRAAIDCVRVPGLPAAPCICLALLETTLFITTLFPMFHVKSQDGEHIPISDTRMTCELPLHSKPR
ncbi:hypothetical protein PybrP1_002852 [[Pythium] brassicae (nom. inval.)]|nr:hypothetical protein PybrP1_002852 [[Pythium] brassicae (nom. inval.)]